MKHLLLTFLCVLLVLPTTSAQFTDSVGTQPSDTQANSLQYIDGIIPSRATSDDPNHDIGTKLREGRLELNDVPFFIIQAIDLVTRIAGGIAVLALVIGGVQYMMGGLSDNKEGGKKTVKYAIIGLLVSFLAWVVVNLIQVQLTGGFGG